MNIEFDAYFDNDSYEQPYSSGREETLSYLSWLELFLDSYEALEETDTSGEEEAVRELLLRGQAYLQSRMLSSVGRSYSSKQGIGLSQLAAEFDLKGFSFFCLLMAIAPELDAAYLQRYRSLQGAYSENGYATFELALRLYHMIAGAEEAEQLPQAMQRVRDSFLFLIHRSEIGGSELIDGFALCEQAVQLVKGSFGIPRELWALCMEGDGDNLPEMIGAENELRRMSEILESERRGLVWIAGKPLSGKKLLIATALKGEPVLFVEMPRLLAMSGEQKVTLLNEILVRCRLLSERLVLLHADFTEAQYEASSLLLDICFQTLPQIIVTSQDTAGSIRLMECYDTFLFTMEPPRLMERTQLWEHYASLYGVAENVALAEYADQYSFTAGQIEKVYVLADEYRRAARREDGITEEELRAAIRQLLPRDIEKLATKIEPKFTFDDIEMDERQKEILRLACNRMKYRNRVNDEWGFAKKVTYGRGVSVLLYGPPGTGKTMSAQAMARELGMELYRVDLSQLVDKYIGETEKNLGRIFDCAKDGNFILFFDEADSLFSKRTEVSGSNDKYANNEVAFLLQKLEEFDGFIILATNVYNNFDPAFIRRITYCVLMEKPDTETRVRMLTRMLPPELPLDPKCKLENLARNFDLTGSEMKSVLYGAAFIAMSRKESLCDEHIIASLRAVLSKTSRLVAESEVSRRYYS